MPSAATSVGTTKGSIKARCQAMRPLNSSRAKTQAMGKPKTPHSTQVTKACTSVQPTRHCRCESSHQGTVSSRGKPATGSPHRPCQSKRATGQTSSASANKAGPAASHRTVRRCRDKAEALAENGVDIMSATSW